MSDDERRDEVREEESDERLSTADLAAGADTGAAGGRDDAAAADERQPLFEAGDAERYRERWREIQAAFVDEPRRAVEDADALVAELMQRLAETFANERAQLERQWDREGDVSTEDLRVGLQRYRSFFDRLLSA